MSKSAFNYEPLYTDFRKVINVLSSSTNPQHIVASDRMSELFSKKWNPQVSKNKDAVNVLECLLGIYQTRKEVVAKRFNVN
jgi:hypothetical protein